LQHFFSHRLWSLSVFALAIVFLSGCNVALGPGYLIQKQDIELHVVSSLEPHVAVHCTYHLLNSGNQPLHSLRIVVPAADAFHRSATSAQWDGHSIGIQTVSPASPSDTGDTVELRLPEPWLVKHKRTLTLDYELSTGFHLGSYLAVGPDTFFVFPESWNPSLLPAKHLFATGGVPPKKWTLFVRVPTGFLVHASGIAGKRKNAGREWLYSFIQQRREFAPFAVGGKYVEREASANGRRILFWTLQPLDPAAAQNAADSLASRAHYYELEYGPSTKDSRTLRLLECPAPSKTFGCGTLPETILVHQAWIARGLMDKEFYEDVNSELAYTWFGGVSRVRFDESPLPMDAVAPYAGWEAQARGDGGDARVARIRSLLSDFDKRSSDCKEKIILPLPPGEYGCSYSPAWTKSALFFFALEDEFGRPQFHQALKSMIQDRRGADFRLQDLISALDSETHHPEGPFVRHWLKHSGIPDDFRARYSMADTPAANFDPNSPKEPHP
jgi:hypothetical protein